MTRKAPRALWRAIVVDEDGHTLTFVLHADDADDAADQAEYQTGLDCVLVDDVTPARKHSNRRPAGVLTVAA
jgi:hypothetical protein